MTLYYIVKRGVYDHGCLGIYLTLSDAKACCEQHTANHPNHWEDGDGYHDFVIYETSVGTGEGREIAVWKGRLVREGRIKRPGHYTWQEVGA